MVSVRLLVTGWMLVRRSVSADASSAGYRTGQTTHPQHSMLVGEEYYTLSPDGGRDDGGSAVLPSQLWIRRKRQDKNELNLLPTLLLPNIL